MNGKPGVYCFDNRAVKNRDVPLLFSNYSAHCKIFLFNRDEGDKRDNIKIKSLLDLNQKCSNSNSKSKHYLRWPFGFAQENLVFGSSTYYQYASSP